MKKNRLLIIISLVDRSLAFEWFFRELIQTGINFQVVFLHPHTPVLMEVCRDLNIKTHHISYRGKQSSAMAFLKLVGLLIKEKITCVHAHLFDASLIGLTAAKFTGIRKRIHTRHHASQHHIYNSHAVKYDRYINRLSTHIIAISHNIKNILVEQEQVEVDKISVVHHGFDLDYFYKVHESRVLQLQEKYGLENAFPVVGVISRWTHWKGLQFIIPAFERLRMKYPAAVLLLANAVGEYAVQIEELLKKLPTDAYRKINFEPDTPALFKLMNVFVHVPVDNHSEAFGQVYVEALAGGVPSVFTLSGIANEFIRHNENALVVNYTDSIAIEDAIITLIINSELRSALIERGKKDVAELFDIKLMVEKTMVIYEN